MKFAHFDFYVRDWLNDLNNRSLTREERGVHIDLLAYLWQQPECRLPDNDRVIASLLGATVEEWQAWRADLIDGPFPVLVAEDGYIYSPRLRREWEHAMRVSQSKSESAAGRWRRAMAQTAAPDPQVVTTSVNANTNADANGDANGDANALQTDMQNDSEPDAIHLTPNTRHLAPDTRHLTPQEGLIAAFGGAADTAVPPPGESPASTPTPEQAKRELVARYREVVPPDLHRDSDYALMGRMLQRLPVGAIATGIDALNRALSQGQQIARPLAYVQKVAQSATTNATTNPGSHRAGHGARDQPVTVADRNAALLRQLWEEADHDA